MPVNVHANLGKAKRALQCADAPAPDNACLNPAAGAVRMRAVPAFGATLVGCGARD